MLSQVVGFLALVLALAASVRVVAIHGKELGHSPDGITAPPEHWSAERIVTLSFISFVLSYFALFWVVAAIANTKWALYAFKEPLRLLGAS